MMSVRQDIFIFLPISNLRQETIIFRRSLAAAKSFIIVAFPLPLCSYMTFIGMFLFPLQE